jgi:hypothetical protein
MNIAESRDFHKREATRLRSLAAKATTAPLKARLGKAEEHDQLAGKDTSGSKSTVESNIGVDT